MLALAVNYQKGSLYLKDIAKGEGISEKYLSLITIPLRRAGLVNSNRGAYGGYSLARSPSQIDLKEIIEALEGELYLVDCLKNPSICSRAKMCKSRNLWRHLSKTATETLNSINLEQLIKQDEIMAQEDLM